MHRSKIDLRTWVLAFRIICASKKGVSALRLQRMLNLSSCQTAWHLCHRIPLAMREQPLAGKLSGIVEADETYMGGYRKGVRPGRPGKDSHKTPVFVLVERNGRVRAQAVPNVTGDTLKAAIREHARRRPEKKNARRSDLPRASFDNVLHPRPSVTVNPTEAAYKPPMLRITARPSISGQAVVRSPFNGPKGESSPTASTDIRNIYGWPGCVNRIIATQLCWAARRLSE